MAVKWSLADGDLGPAEIAPPVVSNAPAGVGRMLLCLQMMAGSAPVTICRSCGAMSSPRWMCKDCGVAVANAFCSQGCLTYHAAGGHRRGPRGAE
jgi:hypothetical protein